MVKRLALTAALVLAGCGPGGDDDAPLSPACREPSVVAEALRLAPGQVRLEDGTLLSSCIDDARSDADLQNVGIALTNAAEDLEARATSDPDAALRLGFLVGAARRGAGSASALQAELVRRLERSAALDPDAATPAARAAVQEGMKAGEARG
jgi:hypothetical protein